MADTERIAIEFTAVDKMSGVLSDMQGSMGKFMGALKAVAAVFITGEMARAVQFFVKAGAESEQATRKMEFALKQMGDTAGKVGEQYDKLFSQMSHTTGFQDNTLKESFTKLLFIVDDTNAAFKSLQVSMDIARITGLDLEQSARLVGRAYEQGGGILKRYGIYVDENARGTKLLQELSEKFQGANKAFLETTSGQWEQLKSNIDSVISKMGEALNKGVVNDVMWFFNSFFKQEDERVKVAREYMEKKAKDYAKLQEKDPTVQLTTTKEAYRDLNTAALMYQETLSGIKAEQDIITDQLSKMAYKYIPDTTHQMDWMVEQFNAYKEEMARLDDFMFTTMATIGQAIGATAAGATDAWASAAKNMLMSVLDFAQNALMAMTIVNGVLNPAMLPAAIAGTVAIGALKGAVGQMGNKPGAAAAGGGVEGGGYAESAASGAAGGAVSSPTAAPAAYPASGGGGGGVVINLINPVFLDRESKERTVSELFKMAEGMGYNITRNTSLVMAQ